MPFLGDIRSYECSSGYVESLGHAVCLWKLDRAYDHIRQVQGPSAPWHPRNIQADTLRCPWHVHAGPRVNDHRFAVLVTARSSNITRARRSERDRKMRVLPTQQGTSRWEDRSGNLH
jgi:hypothetical protein